MNIDRLISENIGLIKKEIIEKDGRILIKISTMTVSFPDIKTLSN
jgi:hypothetical protein